MKKILITGANSYIGTNFENYIKQYEDYQIDTIDMIDGTWRNYDFSGYDVVFHVAGIAHRRETRQNAPLYYEVNRDLAIEVAQKAKNSEIPHFIFLSSMSVYGLTTGVITKKTPPCPKSNYGKSKLEAEMKLREMANSEFNVAIVRPPMVYGEGCKGNYQLLKKAALKLPIFPDIENKRSMIKIENLVVFIKQIIDCNLTGLFYPQDDEYICTSEMVAKIARENGRKIRLTKLFNPIIKRVHIGVFEKIFGDLIYLMEE